MKLIYVFALILLATSIQSQAWMWARGNMHTHTTNSDGDSAPQAVADWYKANGYQFLVISDHERLTDPAPLDVPNGGFVLIPGQEISVKNQGDKPIHGVAVGISTTFPQPDGSATQAKTLQNLVHGIRTAGGIPIVCHPNWCWAFGHRELLGIREPYILEIANMGSGCNNEGSPSFLSLEQTWDILLSEGKEVYAAATDDAHALGTDHPDGSGKGWVVARVPELTRKAIVEALSKGDFYASTGVELADYHCDGKVFHTEAKAGKSYLIQFIGKWGHILQETEGSSAAYRPTGKESYVRSKVIADDGTVAWTQAYRISTALPSARKSRYSRHRSMPGSMVSVHPPLKGG